MARKPAAIDLEELEKLAAMHCTQEEAAAWFGVSTGCISGKLKQKAYKQVWEQGRAKGKISLRRQQKQRADAGDKTMLIWLGKQWLGQKDSPGAEEERHDELRRFLDLMEGKK